MIDLGYTETVAVADLNNDGRKDIISGNSWYEAPDWVKHKLRTLEYTGGYADAFNDFAMDVDGDGWVDVLTGKRYFAHNGADPGSREPIGLYLYEYRKVAATPHTAKGPGNGGVKWIRHIIDYGGRMGGGMQIVVTDIDRDGDMDVVSGGRRGCSGGESDESAVMCGRLGRLGSNLCARGGFICERALVITAIA